MSTISVEVGGLALLAMLSLQYPLIVLPLQATALYVTTGGQYNLLSASAVMVALDGAVPALTPLLAYITMLMSEYAWHRYILHSERHLTSTFSGIMRILTYNHLYGHHADTFKARVETTPEDRRCMRETAGGNQLNTWASRGSVACMFLYLPSGTMYLATGKLLYLLAITISIAASSFHLSIFHNRDSAMSFCKGHLSHHKNPTAGPYGLLPGGEWLGSMLHKSYDQSINQTRGEGVADGLGDGGRR
jgi:hypothetical protein